MSEPASQIATTLLLVTTQDGKTGIFKKSTYRELLLKLRGAAFEHDVKTLSLDKFSLTGSDVILSCEKDLGWDTPDEITYSINGDYITDEEFVDEVNKLTK